ncbi:hypothetical protein GGX14DRAFT_392074 [Mycena pura]|uniref:Uncharacterized protein n=1 Tax=Mycena pura TaxID=153505 RepID=A0AAD6YFS9_9AGAR|nr:hypothetical protein GGX14DRAFT_392074 [Mycena pura]
METSHKTLRDYSKAWLDILKKLRDAKIQHEVKLPHLVAVGVQSAGKSSLLEAISTDRRSPRPRWMKVAKGILKRLPLSAGYNIDRALTSMLVLFYELPQPGRTKTYPDQPR